jgi:hypothetical protein
MWKLILGFIVFAGLALYVLTRGGDIDMSGEKHGTEPHAPAAAASMPAAAPAPMASAPEAAASATK